MIKEKAGKTSSVHFWFGENSEFLQFELARWKEEFAKRHPQGAVITLEFKTSEEEVLAGRLIHDVASQGLFSQRRFIVLKNFSKVDAQSELTKFLLILPEKTTSEVSVLLVEEGKINLNKGLAQSLVKLAESEKISAREFNKFSASELERWVMTRATQKSANLSPEVARLLAAAVGSNFFALDQEIDKLAAYAQGRTVKTSDIDELVPVRLVEETFALVEAVGRRDFGDASAIISQQFKQGANAQALVGMLAWHFRTLAGVRLSLDSSGGKTPSKDLAKELGLHPFVVSRALQQIPYYPLERLRWLYGELSDLDVKLKTSSIDPKVLFSLFLSKLATLKVSPNS